eukprot:gene18627-biopygen9965
MHMHRNRPTHARTRRRTHTHASPAPLHAPMYTCKSPTRPRACANHSLLGSLGLAPPRICAFPELCLGPGLDHKGPRTGAAPQ